MSRSGYCDGGDFENWDMIRWSGAVKSAIRGKRGQAFFKELLAALDAMSNKRLIENDLQDEHGDVCMLGALGRARGLPIETMDSEEHGHMSEVFDIAPALVQEVEWNNDEGWYGETPEQRWTRARAWVVGQIK